MHWNKPYFNSQHWIAFVHTQVWWQETTYLLSYKKGAIENCIVSDSFYYHGLTLIPAGISKHISNRVRDGITYISNFISHCIDGLVQETRNSIANTLDNDLIVTGDIGGYRCHTTMYSTGVNGLFYYKD